MDKKKIVLLPLDERPCNYEFPYKLFNNDEINIVRPEVLGNKKQPADSDKIEEFLIKECKDADGLILSFDTFLYGGLVPSRLHYKQVDDLKNRLEIIKKIRSDNPKLLIYGFQVIMRCPEYSSSDEEPDYYEKYGEMIFNAGNIIHRSRLGLCDESELKNITANMDPKYLEDYVSRREINRKLNIEVINLVKSNWIDFLVIPQDDSSQYGYTAIDQEIVRKNIQQNLLQDKIIMYPGADEVALTLTGRMVNAFQGRIPKVYVKYASNQASFLIPLYEDRTLGETIRYHIMAAGCELADQYESADFILAVTAPAHKMEEAENQPSASQNYCVERNISELLEFIKNRVAEGRKVSIADNAYANGADMEIVELLNKCHLLDKISGYAGWNTSANTLGTSIAEGVNCVYYGKTVRFNSFLMERYLEDAGYCAYVRSYITKNVLKKYGMNYFDVAESEGVISKIVKEKLEEFAEKSLSSVRPALTVRKVRMPWRRMFEIGIDVDYHEDKL